jgi:rare lipoprotein A
VYERGEASYYAHSFAGQKTASGEPFNPRALTAAHRSLPFGTRVRVTNEDNDRHVTARINDRGPYVDDRIIDLSPAAARRLDMTHNGTAPVSLRIISRP